MLVSNVERRIIDFIAQEVLFDSPEAAALTDETPLLEGTIDSLVLMQLVAFLEEEFAVEIDDVEITKEHFATVHKIGELVRSKVG